MCLVKTLLEKTQWEKILVKEKEYTYLLIRTICYLIKKPCQEKLSGKKKPRSREKECNAYYTPPIKASLNFL